jgi:Na+-transporting methylmalonyl-CoA/oxaloacetate decarboxylase gamma subunit
MGLTFAALAVIILLIVGLRALFPERRPEHRPAPARRHAAAERERRAAIAAAVWYLHTQMQARRPADPALGRRLESDPGPYWRPSPTDKP